MLHQRKAEAQEVLDDLWSKKLIPFALSVGLITKTDDEYTIYFYDSRISKMSVTCAQGQPCGDTVRCVVLDQVAKMSGPLANWRAAKG